MGTHGCKAIDVVDNETTLKAVVNDHQNHLELNVLVVRTSSSE
jgi:hypothetical protein